MPYRAVTLGEVQKAQAKLQKALLSAAKGRRLSRMMQPVLENNENLESSLEKQESDILKEIERVMTNLRNEQTRLGEERKSLKEERRATVFERRSERIPSGDENVLVSALQAFAVQAEELKGKLRSTVRTLQRNNDQERHTSELRPGIAGLQAAIPPLPSASVLHPADRDQAVEMLSRTTKELEKVTDERDLALSEARMLKVELDKREQKIHSLTERCGDLQHDDAQEELRRLREKVALLEESATLKEDVGMLPATTAPLISAEFPPVVFVDPVLPSLSSSLTTTPRNGDNEEEDDDRGTLERLIDALTGRGEDETETEHVLHSLEHVVERLSQRCRVLEAAVVDAKQELKWWRTGGGTATFNEAYAKVMAENERHLRLEGQRHSKEKSDLRHSLAQKENKRARYEELWRRSLRLLLDNKKDYLLGLYFHAWSKYASSQNGDREIGRLNAVVFSQSRKDKQSFQTPKILIQQCRSLQDENESLRQRVNEVEEELYRHRTGSL